MGKSTTKERNWKVEKGRRKLRCTGGRYLKPRTLAQLRGNISLGFGSGVGRVCGEIGKKRDADLNLVRTDVIEGKVFDESPVMLSPVNLFKSSLVGTPKTPRKVFDDFSDQIDIIEKIKEIEFEIARTQKNKATEYHLGQLKAKIAKLRTQLLEPPKVSEEVERTLSKLGSANLTERSSPKRIESPDGGNLQLQFRTRLSLPLFTGGKVEGEKGAAIHIVLIDTNTGRVVRSGPTSCLRLDVIVLEGDFNNEDDDGWSQEEFESHVVKEREGKRPLLTGDLQVTLKEGVGTLPDLTFIDNSSWIRSRKFRLGLKVSFGCCEGVRIREAKTEAFTVKDHCGECKYMSYNQEFKKRLDDVGAL